MLRDEEKPRTPGSCTPLTRRRGPTPSPSTSATPSPTASPSAGPGLPADEYCITNGAKDELACYDTEAEATEVLEGATSEVTERFWNVTPTVAEPEPTRSPDPMRAAPRRDRHPDPYGVASSVGVDLYRQLDLNGAERCPTAWRARRRQRRRWRDRGPRRHRAILRRERQGEDLGCYLTQEAADKRQRETGQERLLNVIGTTARWRNARPSRSSRRRTRVPDAPRDLWHGSRAADPRVRAGALDGEEVVYLDGQLGTGNKVRLGPVIITGANFEDASAAP